MNQLKSIYNIPFKDSRAHPIRTCFPMIANIAISDNISFRQKVCRIKGRSILSL